MKKKPLSTSVSAGFSLIELIVVVSILLLITGGGIASFITFNAKQQIINGAKELQEYLRTAQTLARVGEKPAGCDRLTGYKTMSVAATNPKEIRVLAVCDSGDVLRDSFFLPEGTTLSSDIEVVFLGLHGGATGATTIEITGELDETYTFEVTQGGEINSGELL